MPFLHLYDSPQVTKYRPVQASHTHLTHRTGRPHSCNAFDSQLTMQLHRDSVLSHQGTESLLRLSPVSLQQPSTLLLLQYKWKASHYSKSRGCKIKRKQVTRFYHSPHRALNNLGLFFKDFVSNLPLKSIVSSPIFSNGILQTSRFPGNNGPANKISVTRGWFLTETMVLCGLSEHNSQIPSFLVLIDGFQSHDKTAMLVHKAIANYGLCFAY